MIDPKLALAIRVCRSLNENSKGHEDKNLIRQFQLQEGLKADGLYGPKTQKALAKYLPEVPEVFYKTAISGANADLTAIEILNRTPRGQNLSPAEKQYALIVMRHETFYSNGWDAAGAGSNNMGAVQTSSTDPETTFVHADHHEDGTQYVTHFKKYRTKEDGMDDVVRILMKPNVRAALASGNGDEAVAAQRANHYFEAKLPLYRKALVRNYEAFLKNTSQPRLLTFTVDTPVEKKT